MKDFIIHTEEIIKHDGKNIRIKTSGISLKRFSKNPIMLFNHDEDRVLGKWNNVRVEDTVIKGTPVFDVDDESMAVQAMVIKSKVENDTLVAASISIEPIELEWNMLEGVYEITKSSMLEASIVAIPANENALAEELGVVSFSKKGETKLNKLINKIMSEKIELSNKVEEVIEVVETAEVTLENEEVKEEEVVEDTQVEVVEEQPSVVEEVEVTTVEEPVAVEGKLEETELEKEKIELSFKLNDAASTIETLKGETISLSAKVNKLEATNKELEAKVQAFELEKMDFMLNSAISDGKISMANKDQFIKLSFDVAKGIIDNLPATTLSLSADLNAMKAKGNDVHKDYEWYLKNDKQGLIKLGKEQPSLYKTIENAYLAKQKNK